MVRAEIYLLNNYCSENFCTQAIIIIIRKLLGDFLSNCYLLSIVGRITNF